MKHLYLYILAFLLVSRIPCAGQEDKPSVLVHLQRIELRDSNFKRIVSSMIVSSPMAFKPGGWYLLDYYQSQTRRTELFKLDILEYDPAICRLDQSLAFYIETQGVFLAVPKNFPKRLFALSNDDKTLDLSIFHIDPDAYYRFIIYNFALDGPAKYTIWLYSYYHD